MQKDAPIYVAGHRGLVGSAIFRRLQSEGYSNLIIATHNEVDLCDPTATADFFARKNPEYVFLAAAKVGGILANSSYPVDFLRDNLLIELNVIEAAFRQGVKKLLFLGSSCIYPKFAPQPIPEGALLTSALEPTNEWYALAKISGIKLCQAYRKQYGFDAISAMPTNLYGPNDNFDLKTSHVLPALMRKFHEAKISGAQSVEVWGSGTPQREFLHVDDLAEGCLFLMENYSEAEHINIGSGSEVTIRGLAEMIQTAVGFEGELTFDASKPDGTPRKVMDVSRINQLGWQAKTDLAEGIASTYAWYKERTNIQ